MRSTRGSTSGSGRARLEGGRWCAAWRLRRCAALTAASREGSERRSGRSRFRGRGGSAQFSRVSQHFRRRLEGVGSIGSHCDLQWSPPPPHATRGVTKDARFVRQGAHARGTASAPATAISPSLDDAVGRYRRETRADDAPRRRRPGGTRGLSGCRALGPHAALGARRWRARARRPSGRRRGSCGCARRRGPARRDCRRPRRERPAPRPRSARRNRPTARCRGAW
jgi:hypothetical protein